MSVRPTAVSVGSSLQFYTYWPVLQTFPVSIYLACESWRGIVTTPNTSLLIIHIYSYELASGHTNPHISHIPAVCVCLCWPIILGGCQLKVLASPPSKTDYSVTRYLHSLRQHLLNSIYLLLILSRLEVMRENEVIRLSTKSKY